MKYTTQDAYAGVPYRYDEYLERKEAYAKDELPLPKGEEATRGATPELQNSFGTHTPASSRSRPTGKWPEGTWFQKRRLEVRVREAELKSGLDAAIGFLNGDWGIND